MAKRFFCADKHHNHYNIIQYVNRPFKSVEEMNNTLINNHNKIITEDDICYDLGDFYFKGGQQAGKTNYLEFLKQYNGRYVIIRGNHERHNNIIDSIYSCTMRLSNINILCIHDPINANTNYDLVLCGHVHSAWTIRELEEKNKKCLIINVGVDVFNFKPVEWKEIEVIYNQWKCGKIKAEKFDKKILMQLRHSRKQK